MKKADVIQLRAEPVSVESLSDDALIAACGTGDRAARALLFERFLGVVHRFVARMRGSDPDAIEDLVQATFISAFQSAPRYRIAANHTRTYARGEIRRKRALGVVADEAPRTVEPGNLALLAKLPEAIASLSHDLRAVVVLVDLEGERGADAAAALGIPQGTMWRRLYNARQALRAALEGSS